MERKILIVDDEPHILLMVSNRLRANHYQVITALSGRQGLDLARLEKPDLILLDSLMPEMNGIEVLRRLREDKALQPIPVIILTADVKNITVSEFKLRGASEIVFKPFTPEALLSAVSMILNRAS